MKELIDAFAFAPMKYLEKELERYKDGCPNDHTKGYYEALKSIKGKQDLGNSIPSCNYRIIGSSNRKKGFDTAEYGYYTANIHYYLYESCSEYEKSDAYKGKLNARILYFLRNADPKALIPHGWFWLNFPSNYMRFLSIFYNAQVPASDPERALELLVNLVHENGNDDENEIANHLMQMKSD